MTRARLIINALLPLAIGLAAVAGCTSTGQPEAPAAGAQNPPAANAPAPEAPNSSGGSASAGAPAAPTGVPAGATYEEQLGTVGRQFAQCARQNGQPDFPDPVVANGGMGFPGIDKSRMDAAGQSCATILRQLASVPQVGEPPSAETLQHMREFAQCMRQQGVTEWPDPKPDGTFPLLGTPLRGFAQYSGGEGIPPQVTAARQACVQFEQEWRIAAS